MTFLSRIFRRKLSVRKLRVRELTLEDRAGHDRIRMSIDAQNDSVFTFLDRKGNPRLRLGLTAKGTPHIDLLYAGDRGALQLEASEEHESAGIIMHGPNGTLQMLLGLSQEGVPLLAFFDRKGQVMFNVPIDLNLAQQQASAEGFDWDSLLRM